MSIVTDTSPPSNLRDAAWLAAAFLLWIATMILARRVLDQDPSSAWVRAAMVAIAVGGFVAWVAALVRFLRTQDEFSRRVQLVSAVVAFVVAIVAVIAADFLQSAHFLGDVPLDAIWMLMIVAWWLSMIAVARYYR